MASTFTNPKHPHLTAVANELSDRIFASSKKAQAEVGKLSDKHRKAMLAELKTAKKEIDDQIKELAILDPKSEARLLRYTAVNKSIDTTMDRVKDSWTTMSRSQATEAFETGIKGGVLSLKAQEAPGWSKVTIANSKKIATAALGTIDSAGLEFLAAYRIELAGAVADDLKYKIKTSLGQGIIQGKPWYEINRQLGRVIDDPKKFREAGTWTKEGLSGKIFPSASDRIRMIVDTENMRAHNNGRLAFYEDVGMTKARWLTAGDSCQICSALNNKVFPIEDFPTIPAHPDCDCIVVGESGSEKIKAPEDYAA